MTRSTLYDAFLISCCFAVNHIADSYLIGIMSFKSGVIAPVGVYLFGFLAAFPPFFFPEKLQPVSFTYVPRCCWDKFKHNSFLSLLKKTRWLSTLGWRNHPNQPNVLDYGEGQTASWTKYPISPFSIVECFQRRMFCSKDSNVFNSPILFPLCLMWNPWSFVFWLLWFLTLISPPHTLNACNFNAIFVSTEYKLCINSILRTCRNGMKGV